MPPKRPAAGAGGSKAKKSRPSAEGTDSNAGSTGNGSPAELEIPRNKRWAAVSGSGNADDDFNTVLQNPVKAFSFVCLCRPPFRNGPADDSDDEDSDAGDKVTCDGGKTCLCDKPAADHPDHVWKLSVAGKRLFFTQLIHFELRCPDNFDMYTYNDHTGLGVLEILQNLVLDFDEAADNIKLQWAVCEALAFFLQREETDVVTG